MPNEPKIEHPTPQNVKSPEETYRVLFLDSVEHVEQLKGACKDVGYDVVGATTLRQAWAFLDGKDHADVIVCAAHLEDESMFDFLKGVRDSAVHRNVVFLILSLEATATAARFDRSAALAGMQLGADTYLIMPVFDARELVLQIQTLQPARPMLQQSATAEEKRRAE